MELWIPFSSLVVVVPHLASFIVVLLRRNSVVALLLLYSFSKPLGSYQKHEIDMICVCISHDVVFTYCPLISFR